jgi:hypothetical protein
MGENVFGVASGYHRPAPFHKDDNRAGRANRRQGIGQPWRVALRAARPAFGVPPKLLNMRDFQALSGFPSQQKRATIRVGKRVRARAWSVPAAWHFMPDAHWPAEFRAYMVQIHP